MTYPVRDFLSMFLLLLVLDLPVIHQGRYEPGKAARVSKCADALYLGSEQPVLHNALWIRQSIGPLNFTCSVYGKKQKVWRFPYTSRGAL